MKTHFWLGGSVAAMLLSACATVASDTSAPKWETIFDGETLTGWTPKISGQELGEDTGGIFRAENGALIISYESYSKFSGEYGHLFFTKPMSDYRLRFSYAFGETQTPGGPGWAFMNSGVMVHSQSPETMRVDQSFPVSVEAQLLGKRDATMARTTANVCTPGTHVVIDGELTTQHCVNSQTQAQLANTWTQFEMDVRSGVLIALRINGTEALRLTDPVFDHSDPDVARLGLSGAVTRGYFALQAESHPVRIRDIELMRLDPEGS